MAVPNDVVIDFSERRRVASYLDLPKEPSSGLVEFCSRIKIPNPTMGNRFVCITSEKNIRCFPINHVWTRKEHLEIFPYFIYLGRETGLVLCPQLVDGRKHWFVVIHADGVIAGDENTNKMFYALIAEENLNSINVFPSNYSEQRFALPQTLIDFAENPLYFLESKNLPSIE